MPFISRDQRRAGQVVDATQVLYWIYAARLTVCLGVYGSALLIGSAWSSAGTGAGTAGLREIALVGLAVAAAGTPLSYWHTHRRHRPPGQDFLYAQALLDIVLVTGMVHITGGSASVFPPLLYIALASGYSLLMPFASAVFVAFLCGVAYMAEIVG
ncbi:MAG TPA: hypothetical protein VKA44_07245, partial [Gemmatimonadota bacterium]|nr:hypothetical protein [Gemmatimonadota bacterium]